MDLNDLNELELQNIGEWPVAAKAVVIILLCAALGFAWYYFDSREQLEDLSTEQAKELDLRAKLESKQEKAANLEAFEQQLLEMQESFGAMLRQLPDRTEVAALLVDVSQTGLAAGLEFELFQPAGEVNKDFYAELPIRVRVTGTYHDFGRFISGLAVLPRIVTVHDVVMSTQGRGAQEGARGQRLALDATVKTYRYLEEGSAP